MRQPKCYDLFCGLGGWAEGFLSEGYDCVGFDIEAHDYGTGGYPGTLVVRDIRTIHGSELKDATIIVASPPCQAYSYRAMPWSRAKALPPPDNTLFNECWRIQRDASAAAGHHIPMIVENVRGAQKWVGKAQWHFGSFYLWGDVPALMPMTFNGSKLPKGNASSPLWKDRAIPVYSHQEQKVGEIQRHLDNRDGVKQSGICGVRENGLGDRWFQDGAAKHGSKSNRRKASSAMIAKIPFPLAQHIARCYNPNTQEKIYEG